MSTTTVTPNRAGTREWIAMSVLVLPALLVSMDLSVLFMAAPWISADLSPGATEQLWIMDIYGFVMAGLLVTMGTAGDRFGRRRLLILGALAFGAASLIAAYASSAAMLIAARALLGVGAATLAPSTLSLIRTLFTDENQRRGAIGIWTAAFTSGFAVGPIVGGLLLEHFHWGSVFLINLPIMALVLVTAPLLIPESRDPNPGPFDLVSAGLSLGAVLGVIYGIKKIVENGVGVGDIAAILAGVVCGALFLRRQLSRRSPLIDVRLFARPAFGASILANMTVVFATAGMGYLVVTFVQSVLGYSPFDAALWLVPAALGSLVGAVVASVAGSSVRPAILIAAGLTASAAGFFWVATVDEGTHIGVLVAAYALLTVGVGMTATLATSLVLTTAPPEKAGAASAISETSAEFGGALGIAVLGMVATGIYTRTVAEQLPHDVEAAADTIGAAVAVAHEAPAALRPEILEAAFSAYSSGLSATATIGGTLVVAVAVLTGLALRGVAPSVDGEGR